MKRAARVAALALVALVLLYLFAARGGLTWPAVAQSIGRLAGPALVWLTALSAAVVACGTLKWLLVMRAFAPDCAAHPRFVDAMLTTTLGAILGQVMPVQLGVALTRSLAGRWGIGRSPGANLGATAYEQLFDAVVLGIASAVGLLGLLLRPGPGGWVLLIALAGAAGIVAAMRLTGLLVIAARLLARTPASNRLYRAVARYAGAAGRAGELSPSVFARLILLSILRYVANLLRIVVVLGALGMSADAVPTMLAFPLLQWLSLVPITPGNLGVVEWTWSAVLVAAGASMTAAALFAVTARIAHLAAQSIVLVLLLAWRLCRGWPLPAKAMARREPWPGPDDAVAAIPVRAPRRCPGRPRRTSR